MLTSLQFVLDKDELRELVHDYIRKSLSKDIKVQTIDVSVEAGRAVALVTLKDGTEFFEGS